MAKRPKSPQLSIDDFTYLPEDSPPRLILGLHYTHADFRSDLGGPRPLNFHRGRNWERIAVQTSGVGCHQHFIVGTFLSPTPVAAEGMRRLEKHYYESDCGVFGNSLDSIIDYRANLKTWLGVDCNRSYKIFEEAIYPIDVEFAQKLCVDSIPSDLDEWVDWRDGMERAMGCVGRWSLLVVCGNSD